MAVFRARALAVAAGVPAVFAVLAGLLTVGAPQPTATAAEPAPAAQAPAFAVSRALVRPIGPTLPVSFHLASKARVAFITIDDGVTKDMRGLRYVERLRLPVTAFLTAWTVKDRADYFRRITAWGTIQNHSATHASMARSTTDLDHEICYTQRALESDFGSRPWLMRPPYGAGYARMETQVTARRCGIEQLVMWDAVVEKGRLTNVSGDLKPGAIVLLHFTPDLEKDLRTAVRAIREAGLEPANLAAYLPRQAA